MRDELRQWQRPREDQRCGLLLAIPRGAIAPQNFFFFHTYGGGGKFDLHVRIVLRKKQHASAGPRDGQPFGQRGGQRYGNQHRIRSSAFRADANFLRNRARQRIECRGRTETLAHRAPLWHRIGGEHKSAGPPCEQHQEQADWTLSNDYDAFAGGYTRLLYCLQAGVHRLDERGFLEAHLVLES